MARTVSIFAINLVSGGTSDRTRCTSLAELKQVPAADLKTKGFTAKELREADFTLAQLKEAGFTAKELREADFTVPELRLAGFTEEEVREALGFHPLEKVKVSGAGSAEANGVYTVDGEYAGAPGAGGTKSSIFSGRLTGESSPQPAVLKALNFTS